MLVFSVVCWTNSESVCRWGKSFRAISLTLTGSKGATCCSESPTLAGTTWALPPRFLTDIIVLKRTEQFANNGNGVCWWMMNAGGCWQVDRVGTVCSSASNKTRQKPRGVKLSQVMTIGHEYWMKAMLSCSIGRDPKGLFKNFNYHRCCLQCTVALQWCHILSVGLCFH